MMDETSRGGAVEADVAVLGIGAMGAALVRALMADGLRVTVWNRTPGRARAFNRQAVIAASPAEAAQSAPLVILCLSDYAAVSQLISPMLETLRGRTLCSMGSSTPTEARALAERVAPHDIAYLDAAIASYPARIGDPGTAIFYAGDQAAFDMHRGALTAMGGATRFCGADAGAASAMDLAWLNVLGGALLGLLEGAALCDAEGVDAREALKAMPSFATELIALASEFSPMLASGDYRSDQSPLRDYLPTFEGMVTTARDSGVGTAFPRSIRDAIADGIDAGLGDLEFAALFERLRRPTADPRPGAAGAPPVHQ